MEILGRTPVHRVNMQKLKSALQAALAIKSPLDCPNRWDAVAEEIAKREPDAPRLPGFNAFFDLTVSPQGDLSLKYRSRPTNAQANGDLSDSELVREVTAMCREYRRQKLGTLHPADRLALLRAFQLVETGVLPSPTMQPIHTNASRTCPTYLSLADPGLGHQVSTCWDSAMLNGSIVHIETIDRQGIADTGQIEAYRIPSIRDVARIRVLVGEEAPCSVYVGRPVFEGLQQTVGVRTSEFRKALLKTAHTVAAGVLVCSHWESPSARLASMGSPGARP